MRKLVLDLSLAREIELAEAEAAVTCAKAVQAAQPGTPNAYEVVGGGYAVYCGANSPVTQAVGLGLNGPISREEFDRLEEFYFRRREAVRVETCPLADASLLEHYKERGYSVSEFSNVLVRSVDRKSKFELPAGLQIQKARSEELDLWVLTVAQGFADSYPVTQEVLQVMKLFTLGTNVECYLARMQGRVAGGATLALRGNIAGFFGASTLREFRNHGVQTALLQVRMNRAAEVGSRLAVSLARPGSTSQRNLDRVGFGTLYTRVKFERAFVESGGLANGLEFRGA